MPTSSAAAYRLADDRVGASRCPGIKIHDTRAIRLLEVLLQLRYDLPELNGQHIPGPMSRAERTAHA
jgi:hypothetical protein